MSRKTTHKDTSSDAESKHRKRGPAKGSGGRPVKGGSEKRSARFNGRLREEAMEMIRQQISSSNGRLSSIADWIEDQLGLL